VAAPWWQESVLYQIYPRSFADANGDGVGDLPGIIEHLDHLAWLGIDGLWLSPITPSPDADWGYDVADYCGVHPALGTLDDCDRLIAEAGARGIRVLLDLVPNHTSDQHSWFVTSRSTRDAPQRDWYVWADPKPDGSPPNNWVSSFGGAAWTLDASTGQYYLHNHLAEQPDLNWWNPEVRAAFDGVLRFWWDRGVAGFRIDVCNVIIKDAELRDNPPATADDDLEAQLFGQRAVYNTNRPEVHEVISHWRALADADTPPRVLVGETPVPIDDLARYYGNGADELHLAFNFPFLTAPFTADALRAVVEHTERALPRGAWPAWTGSNHDMFRLATRWAEGDERKIRLALVLLLSLRGTPVLFQGDEIGLPDVPVQAREDLRDPLGVRYWPHYAGRDAARSPMQWRAAPGGGFTAPASTPWLPLGDVRACNVADQRAAAGSVLHLVRDVIALRRATPDLRLGAYAPWPTPDAEGLWAWRRGIGHLVALNLSESAAQLAVPGATVCLRTDGGVSARTERVERTVDVGPWEGAIMRLEEPPTTS
jgi:alpha-glucosidase